MGPTLYDVVGALRDASPSTLKRAYRALALENHPDKHAQKSDDERKEVEAKFLKMQEAYEHLSKLHNIEKQKRRGEEGDPEEF